MLDLRTGEPGRTRFDIEGVTRSKDGRTLRLEIPDLEPAMQMHLHWDLDFQDAETRSSFVHFTVHGLHAPSLVE